MVIPILFVIIAIIVSSWRPTEKLLWRFMSVLLSSCGWSGWGGVWEAMTFKCKLHIQFVFCVQELCYVTRRVGILYTGIMLRPSVFFLISWCLGINSIRASKNFQKFISAPIIYVFYIYTYMQISMYTCICLNILTLSIYIYTHLVFCFTELLFATILRALVTPWKNFWTLQSSEGVTRMLRQGENTEVPSRKAWAKLNQKNSWCPISQNVFPIGHQQLSNWICSSKGSFFGASVAKVSFHCGEAHDIYVDMMLTKPHGQLWVGNLVYCLASGNMQWQW